MLSTSSRVIKNIVVIDLAGSLDVSSKNDLKESIKKLSRKGRIKIIFNLRDLAFIDSSGLGVLVASFSSIRRMRGVMKIVNVNNLIQDLFDLTRLSSIFEIHDSEEEAVRAINGLQTESGNR